MSGLVMADEVERFNADEQVMARLYGFLSIFLWPITYVVTRVVMWLLLELVGLDLPSWLSWLLCLAVMVALVRLSLRWLRRLRAADAALDAFYAAPPAGQAAAQATLAALLPIDPESASFVIRLGLTAQRWTFAAPLCTAKCLRCRGSRLDWDEARAGQAKALFETLGGNGGAWVALADHAASTGAMAGLERMGLIEHRVNDAGVAEIRIQPDMRRRHFPKDPNAPPAFAPPTRASRSANQDPPAADSPFQFAALTP